jgi:hypothetical protein
MSFRRIAVIGWALAGAIPVLRAYLLRPERASSRDVHPHPFDP